MRKIPTMFVIDWASDRSRMLAEPHPDCGWVFRGEGVPTVKLDGTCCMVRSGVLYKRRGLKQHDKVPTAFELVSTDEETGTCIGWMPVSDGPDDKYHREAFVVGLADGTYELVGPKIQGGTEGFDRHRLINHDDPILVITGWNASGVLHTGAPPRTYDGLKQWFSDKDIEGIVFHHPDGRMAKIKKRDFGLTRTVRSS